MSAKNSTSVVNPADGSPEALKKIWAEAYLEMLRNKSIKDRQAKKVLLRAAGLGLRYYKDNSASYQGR